MTTKFDPVWIVRYRDKKSGYEGDYTLRAKDEQEARRKYRDDECLGDRSEWPQIISVKREPTPGLK